jgi:hypothetical protein
LWDELEIRQRVLGGAFLVAAEVMFGAAMQHSSALLPCALAIFRPKTEA